MKPIVSTLAKITEQVFTAKSCNEAKTLAISYLETTRVKHKEQMIIEINKCTTLYQIQKYCCNSLLKYEGLSLNKKVGEAE